MNRRELMTAGAALALAPAAAIAAPLPLKDAAREAWLYGLPLIEIATTRARALAGPAARGVNRFVHARELAGPQARGVTTPNNDTLYSTAWIDLTRGPVVLTIPPTGDRYISVAVMNMYSDNDAVLGTRVNGGGGGRYTLVGPGQRASGRDVVRISTPHAWMLARILVDGPEDLVATRKVQDGLGLEGPTGMTYPASPTRAAAALDYLAGLGRLIAADPPPAADAPFFASIAALGLTADGAFDPKRFGAAEVAEIEAGVAEARGALRGSFGGAAPVQGWSYPPASLGLYGTNYHLRAAVALGGLAALPQAEAMYMNPVGDRGRMFTGPGPYRLHFPAGQLPPVDAFWSVTMYEATPEGQLFLVENPIRRYAIGDRTPGLRKNPDGSLDIWIARSDPGGERSANWLPAPAQGPFTVSFRAYLPRRELREGRYRLPAIQPA